MKCLGLHNKPKAEVHPGHKLTGPKEEEEGTRLGSSCDEIDYNFSTRQDNFIVIKSVRKLY
jgi:hypothetical protein